MTTARDLGWDRLQDVIAGDVVVPDSPLYDVVRKPAIARFDDIRPQAVVRCGTPEDVRETVAFAARSGLPTAVRSGGHCFAGGSSTEGIVIDVSPMSSVSVSNGVATIGAGAQLGVVYDALSQHRVTIPAGCGATVGISGLTLGGGLGILGRTHGVTSDGLVGAQVVLADGRIVACDGHHDGELFWALRGAGGGNLGVVTSLAFRPVPEPAATTFSLAWPAADAVAVIAAWQAWAPDAPDELAASLLLTVPGDRRAAVTVFGAYLGTESDTMPLLDAFAVRVGTDPASASHTHGSYRTAKRDLNDIGDQIHGIAHGESSPVHHAFSKSEFFGRPLPLDAITRLVEHAQAQDVPGQARVLDFTPMGGAYNRVRADATAFVHRDARFLLKHEVNVDPTASHEQRGAAQRWLARSWESVHPWGSGHAYQNFPDPELDDAADAYYGANRPRLRQVKSMYDPDGFFR
jgi:FAD/FMN-containing dehydrogenase